MVLYSSIIKTTLKIKSLKMSDLPNDILILEYIDENGPQGFNDLDKSLQLARNTISKYLNQMRNQGFIESKWENKTNKKLNHLTPEGKLALESYLGQNDKFHQLQSYYLFEEKIKEIRDGFLERYGNLPNSFLLDCIEIFLDIFTYKFASKLPSKDFQYHLSFFLSNWDIQYCRSEYWTRTLPKVMQLAQNEFCKKYNLEQTEIEYFCLQWSKIKKLWPIYDKQNRIWFLSSTSLFYEMLMEHIYLRTRRGSLQELVFENFFFNSSNEAVFIFQGVIQDVKLKIDNLQRRQLLQFVRTMISYFLSKRKGYKELWHDFPSDPQELLKLAVNLEVKLEKIDENSPRRLEIYRSLRKINAKLNNYKEASLWTEKYLNLEPEDPSMITLLLMDYLYLEEYDNFLLTAEKIRQKNKYEALTRIQLLRYFVEINPDHKKALEILKELDWIAAEIPDVQNQLAFMEYYRIKLLIEMNQFEIAQKYAEKLWYNFEAHTDEIFLLLTEIYKKLELWELLEDFCLDAYVENKFSPERMSNLFYAHIKRNSFNKARYIYNWVKTTYPEYFYRLEDIRKELNISVEEIQQ